MRALRPLKRKVPSWHEDEVILDEDATAEQPVQDGLWLPVTKRGTTRWLDLTLVVDTSPSMALWQATVTVFMSLSQQLGAFRTIQLRLLDTHRPAGGSSATPVLRGGTAATPIRSPAELLDLSGRRIVLVLTDGVGQCWRQDLVSPLLAQWGGAMPVAVGNGWTGSPSRNSRCWCIEPHAPVCPPRRVAQAPGKHSATWRMSTPGQTGSRPR